MAVEIIMFNFRVGVLHSIHCVQFGTNVTLHGSVCVCSVLDVIVHFRSE